jgi:hypothetical protein
MGIWDKPHHLDGNCEVLEDAHTLSRVRKHIDKAVTWYRTVKVVAGLCGHSDSQSHQR